MKFLKNLVNQRIESKNKKAMKLINLHKLAMQAKNKQQQQMLQIVHFCTLMFAMLKKKIEINYQTVFCVQEKELDLSLQYFKKNQILFTMKVSLSRKKYYIKKCSQLKNRFVLICHFINKYIYLSGLREKVCSHQETSLLSFVQDYSEYSHHY